jgi:rare lipoprotein A
MPTVGLASWYGLVLQGHHTASGERFNKDELTAAHRTLPFGTLVRVVDLSTGRSIVVRINDRGVLFADRVIDLSSAAANELGILREGVAKVRLEVLKKAPPAAPKPATTEAAAL